MKKGLLLLTCMAVFALTISCQKAGKVLLISAHTWVVTADSPAGVPGDEYTFHDNRLFFHSGSVKADGDWDFPDISDLTYIDVNTEFSSIQYNIITLTGNELVLEPSGTIGLPIKFAPKTQ